MHAAVVLLLLAAAGTAGAWMSPRGAGAVRRSSALRMSGPRELVTHYEELGVVTLAGISLSDITQEVKAVLQKSGCQEGVLTVLSKHSTVSVIIQEFEKRFVDDARQFLHKLAPKDEPYLHNDLDFRTGPSDWPGGDEAWRAFRAKEPVNTHSHLLAMVLGTSESIPIHEGKLTIGTYQNIIIVDADGCFPGGNKKKRTICVQITGSK